MFAITYVPQKVEPVPEGTCAVNLLETQFKEARVGGVVVGRGTWRERQRKKGSPHKCIIKLVTSSIVQEAL